MIFPTHRVFAGRPDVDPPGEERLERGRCGRGAGSRARRSARPPCSSVGTECASSGETEGELDVELVDRFGHEGISYTPDRDEAVRRVESGEADAALLVRPLRVVDVFERAREGRKLPQKATYFFPKLVSGLLLHPVDP